MDDFLKLTELLNQYSPAALLALFVFLAGRWWYRYNARIFLSDDKLSAEAEQRRLNDLNARKQWIAQRHYETLYLDFLGDMLDWLARVVTRDQAQLERNHPSKGVIEALFGVQPFTEGSYLLCLRLALFYPFAAFLLVWVSGGSGTFAGLSVLPGEAAGYQRWLFLLGIAMSVGFLWKFARGEGMVQWVYLLCAIASVIASAFALALALNFIRKRCTHLHQIALFWMVFNLFYLALSVTVIAWVLERDTPVGALLPIVFIVLLPLVNAIMDWLSLGVTRGLLCAIRQGTHSVGAALAYVLLDIVLALAFLVAIVSLTIVLLAAVNAAALHGSGQVFMDLQQLFDGLAADPLALEYGWIHVMMLSTLVPTLIHFTVGAAAAVMVLPNRWRESILQHWDQRGDAQTAALWYVTLVPMIGLAAPLLALYGLYLLLGAHGGLIGYGLLDWARGLATVFDGFVMVAPR